MAKCKKCRSETFEIEEIQEGMFVIRCSKCEYGFPEETTFHGTTEPPEPPVFTFDEEDLDSDEEKKEFKEMYES